MTTATMPKRLQRLYVKDPWSVMGGRVSWPCCDTAGPATHWNDGHYGLLCFTAPPPSCMEFLREHLPGWVIHRDPGNMRTVFRTTNSNWEPR